MRHLTKLGGAFCTAALVTTALGTAPAVPAEANRITISPDSGTGWPSTEIAVTGSGCPAGTTGQVLVGLRAKVGATTPQGKHAGMSTVTVNPDGSFSGTVIPAPLIRPGPHLVYAICLADGNLPLAWLTGPFFEVLPSTAMHPGVPVRVRITRVSPDGREWVTLRNEVVDTNAFLRGFTPTQVDPAGRLGACAGVDADGRAGPQHVRRQGEGATRTVLQRADVWSSPHDAALLYNRDRVLLHKLTY
jgi:hypothetical protein